MSELLCDYRAVYMFQLLIQFILLTITPFGPLCCRELDLKKPIYQRTAAYGHFGREAFPWEVPKKLKY